ncbi:MAG: ABC transporter permease subunit [Firmicutes bacterium]|nr:ABC transporter permease subunit [Bacillota bacterium]
MQQTSVMKPTFSLQNTLKNKVLPNWELYLFCLAGIVITIIFHYVPLYGIQIAFRDFVPRLGITGSQWIGMAHFERFFNSPLAMRTIENTLILSFYQLIAGFPIPILLALMLNSFRHERYRKVIQTVTYAPHFISVVVMTGMILLFLSPSAGIVNTILQALGMQPVNFMADASIWRHIFVWSGVWQGMGFSSVLYFATLSGISPEYYEAAKVDGATKLQMMRHIEIPMLVPMMTMMLILAFGSLMSVSFERVLALQNDLNMSVSEVIGTYTYRVGLLQNDMGFSAAIGLFNSAVNAVLLIVVNFITGKFFGRSLF